MADSAIEWTDATWNPTTGCSLASEVVSIVASVTKQWQMVMGL